MSRQMPWWVWVVGVFVLLQVLGSRSLGSLIPFFFIGFVIWQLMGKGGGPQGVSRGPGGPPPADDHDPYPWAPGSTQGQSPVTGPQGELPTIDVPRYPGAAGQPSHQVPAPPAGGYGIPAPPTPPGGGGATGSDPTVSLGRLQVAQSGRDLRQAQASGDVRAVQQALDHLGRTLAQVEGSLASAAPSPEARAFRSQLSGVRAVLGEATRSGLDQPAGRALVDRIATTSIAMGQTGPHE